MLAQTLKYKPISFNRYFYRPSLRFSLSLLLLLALSYPSLLRAQVLNCTGSACPPEILNNIDSLGDTLKINYGRQLASTFSRAHAISNVALLPHIADVSLGLFTVGIELSAGLDKSSFDLEGGSSSGIEQADFKGTFSQGLTYGGLNLGLLSTFLGMESDVLDSIDVYFGLTNAEINYPLGHGFDSLEYNFNTLYLGLRYQLIEDFGIFIAGWQGLSFHIGRIISKTNIKLEDEDDDPDERFKIAGFNWQAANEIELKSEADTTIMELNTGFKILFLSISLGAGIAYHFAETNVNFSRSGNLYSSDTELDAVLNAEFENRSGLEAYRTYYMKMGIEFGLIPFTSIGVEGVYHSKDLYSIGLGTRVNI